ncbi:MAG: hypothetical protein GC204_15630, partial [Chloroflexi bacterium]|nr:hypothetical protein [Chloroflexota bacterium]
MSLTTKILVSAPSDGKLDTRQVGLKNAIRRAIQRSGFELQEFGANGIPRRTTWTYENVEKVLRQCQGIAVLAFNIGTTSWSNGTSFGTISEYNHIEGTLALAQSLPLFVVTESNNATRGILYQSSAKYLILPIGATGQWVRTNAFKSDFEAWRQQVNARYHVFLGYSSGARTTASSV